MLNNSHLHRIELTERGFNRLLPEYLQRVSKIHFTPIHVAQLAAEWLTEDGKKNILDIGAGVGKFCISGAGVCDSFFHGIEYRPSLVSIANELIKTFEVSNAAVYNRNILDIEFADYDAFYIYNPFYENIEHSKRLNNEVPLADALHRSYSWHTEQQLNLCKSGCRVVTYHGDNLEIPASFEKVRESKTGLLKLWIKR